MDRWDSFLLLKATSPQKMPEFSPYKNLTSNTNKLREVLKKTLDGLNPQWGGGFWAKSTFHVIFTFNLKIMSKNWKRMIKQW